MGHIDRFILITELWTQTINLFKNKVLSFVLFFTELMDSKEYRRKGDKVKISQQKEMKKWGIKLKEIMKRGRVWCPHMKEKERNEHRRVM